MKNQPKIKVSATTWEKLFNFLSVIILICSVIYVVMTYNSLPETVPTHFNAQGEADGWGSKKTVFIMPIIAITSFLIMYFVAKVPHVFNFTVEITEENAPRLYSLARTFMAVINFEVVAILSYITWGMVQSAKNGTGIGTGFIIFVTVVPIVTVIILLIRMNKAQ